MATLMISNGFGNACDLLVDKYYNLSTKKQIEEDLPIILFTIKRDEL